MVRHWEIQWDVLHTELLPQAAGNGNRQQWVAMGSNGQQRAARSVAKRSDKIEKYSIGNNDPARKRFCAGAVMKQVTCKSLKAAKLAELAKIRDES